MILESCALKAGLPIGFSAVITQAGVAAPLPLLPLLPLPRPGRLGNVVARMLHPLEGTLWCTDVGLTIGQFFRVDDKSYFLLERLVRLDLLRTEYELAVLQDAVWGSRVVPEDSGCVLLFADEAQQFCD